MATPKKKVRIRDADSTKRALLDAVGEILREKGFAALRTNVITRWISKDKNLIRYHFQGLSGLLRTYIGERDYWPPFLERFYASAEPKAEVLKNLFSQMMKDNLSYFSSNVEMQKIILWQISQENALMKSISQSREIEGDKLFAMTDPFFAGTDVSFRSVISLILGGVYYMVLQTEVNNGPVCGIDVRKERDRETVMRTIGQIISWAWQDGKGTDEENNNLPIDMNYEFEVLDGLVSDFKKEGQGQTEGDLEKLSIETARLERVLLGQLLSLKNETQIRTFLKVVLHKLSGIADGFYVEDGANVEADLILELIGKVRRPVEEYVPRGIRLPRLFHVKQVWHFEVFSDQIRLTLEGMNLDHAVINMVMIPFEQFILGKKAVDWNRFRYLQKYKEGLLEMLSLGRPDIWQVFDQLISLGYNHVSLRACFAVEVRKLLGESAAGNEKILKSMAKRVQQISLSTMLSYDEERDPVRKQALDWLEVEQSFLEEDGGPAENQMKLNSTLKAAELSLWYKLQYDHGVFMEVTTEEFSEKIAYNFSSKNQHVLSAPSIKSKFYSKERVIMERLEELLIAMLEDIRRFLR